MCVARHGASARLPGEKMRAMNTVPSTSSKNTKESPSSASADGAYAYSDPCVSLF